MTDFAARSIRRPRGLGPSRRASKTTSANSTGTRGTHRTASGSVSGIRPLWHLDRMIAIRPGAAWLYARRLRVLQLSGFDVHADEKQFRSLASPAELVAWDSEEAVRHEASANWSAAMPYFDRLVAAMPADDWLRHRRGARARSTRSLARGIRRALPLHQAGVYPAIPLPRTHPGSASERVI